MHVCVCVCVCDRNGVKLLLGTGAVYVTVNEGVWSTSESGLCAAQRLRTYVLPETTQYWDKVIGYSMYAASVAAAAASVAVSTNNDFYLSEVLVKFF